MDDILIWHYPDKKQFPETKDGLVFCETKNHGLIKLLYFFLDGKHRFFCDELSSFVEVVKWKYLE